MAHKVNIRVKAKSSVDRNVRINIVKMGLNITFLFKEIGMWCKL